jgi:hypothetical protein
VAIIRHYVGDFRHGLHVARTRGTGELAIRGLKRLQERVGTAGTEVALHVSDISRPLVPEIDNPLTGTEKPRVGFVMTPPGASSGGHRTIGRVISALQKAGMDCRVLLYDYYGEDVERHASVAGDVFPNTPIGNAREWAPGDLHAIFATSWESAQFVARSRIVGKRFYLIQDFEPWFYAKGTASELAEQTYTFGMRGIAIGSWLSEFIENRFGMRCDSFPFACDVDAYGVENRGHRGGVAFYARPATPRRAFGLGMLALGLVNQSRPDLDIHLFGSRTRWKNFPVIDHGPLAASDLNRVYNECAVGLVLSMTNISLVPWEMLAAGCVPVVNLLSGTRNDLDNEYVRYAEPTPEGIATSVLEAVDGAASLDLDALSSSVASLSWDASIRSVASVVTRELAVR